MIPTFERGARVVYEVQLTVGAVGRFVGTVTDDPTFYAGCDRYTVREDGTGRLRPGCEAYNLKRAA